MKVVLCAAWVASSLYFSMRIVSYNCMSAVEASRIQDFTEHLQIAQVLCLQGTRFRINSPYIGCRHDNFFAIWWGYGRGTHTSRSTGCSTCINNRFRKERDIAGIFFPPKTLSGRGGAVRLRHCAADVVVMNLFFPSRVVSGKGVQLYKTAVDEPQHWAREAPFLTKARSSIFVCLDLNDKLGLPAPGEASQAVGLLALGDEGYAAQGFRRLLNEFDLAAFNTWSGGQATYFGFNQRESRIDFVCGPRQKLPLCKNVPVLMMQGRKLQTVNSSSKFDHYPVMLNVEYRLEFSSIVQDQHTAWDRDTPVAAAISKTASREGFLAAGEQMCLEKKAEWMKLEAGDSVDLAWESFIDDLKKVALTFFENNKDSTCDLRKLRREIRTLLRERAELRLALGRVKHDASEDLHLSRNISLSTGRLKKEKKAQHQQLQQQLEEEVWPYWKEQKPMMLGELHGASLVQVLGLADVFTGGLRTVGLLLANGMNFLQHLVPKVNCILVRLNLHSRWKRTKSPTLRHFSATLLKPCRTWLISGGLLYATFPFESRLRLGRRAVVDSGDEVFAAIGEPLLQMALRHPEAYQFRL